MLKNLKKIIGADGERKALRHLVKHGLKLITKNYSCRYGEIDLIMHDNTEVVFVEVRWRKNSRFCHPAETVNAAKQLRLHRTALHYIKRYNVDAPMRFDVVGIENNHHPTWIKDAFALQY